jgi:hypothetical protein
VKKSVWMLYGSFVAALLSGSAAAHAEPHVYGREFYMVRSGRVQLIIQTDRADLGPAVTNYILDPNNIGQNNKGQAFNLDGARSGALEVVSQKSGYAFTAFGENTRARWIETDGIPEVEATWWADGVQVSERFVGLLENNTIRRTISLTGADLHGDEHYSLRLRLPAGNAAATNRALLVTAKGCPQALVVTGDAPIKMDAVQGVMEIGPLTVSPGKTVTVKTFLLAQIPASTQTAADFQKQIARVADNVSRAQLLQATRDRWGKQSKIVTDDALVQEVFDITRCAAPANASEQGFYRGGRFQYPQEWVRDNSLFTLGLTAIGNFEQARAVLEHTIRDLITAEGTTMIASGFDNPDREQLDQVGELLLALRWYADLSGDPTLASTYRGKIIAAVERPLNPNFRDATGLVHNRREFWEQTMNDAYELSYNTYVITALRDAAAMAPLLGAEDRKQRWLKESDAMQAAMLKLLVEDGAFIKRRDVTGKKAEHLVEVLGQPDVPCKNTNYNRIYPDATLALPVALGLAAPGSELASRTLDEIEKLRNQRWSGGGYGRYDTSAEINTPGPWGIAGAMIIRGQHAGGQLDRSRRTLEWFRTVQGGNSGLYEEEIPLIRSEQGWHGLVSWPTGELPFFFVHHYLGVTFDGGAVVIRPQLYPNSPPVKADLRFRKGRLKLEIPGAGPYRFAEVNNKRIEPEKDGAFRLPADFAGGTVAFHSN